VEVWKIGAMRAPVPGSDGCAAWIVRVANSMLVLLM
jgi:hypothetical protein